MEKFHYYCYGKVGITAETDHLPLLAVYKKGLNKCLKKTAEIVIAIVALQLQPGVSPGHSSCLG